MTIQQAHQVLGLEGQISIESAEKQFAELYNDAHTRLLNEFDAARGAQIKVYIAELQEAIKAIKNLPSVNLGTDTSDANLTYAEFLQLIGLGSHASSTQVTKALKARLSQLKGLLASSFSPEMSLLAERERIKLEKAATLYVPAKGTKAIVLRGLRIGAIIVGLLSVITVIALVVWKRLNNTSMEHTKKVEDVRKALKENDLSAAYFFYSKHKYSPWLKDSISDADRQHIITGCLDLTFEKIAQSIQENMLDTARSKVELLLDIKKYDSPEHAWNYPWDKKLEETAILLLRKKAEGVALDDYKRIVGPCVYMLDRLLQNDNNTKDELAWHLTISDNTKGAYERYKKDYPKGRYVFNANEQLEILSNNSAALARATGEYRDLLHRADLQFNSGHYDEAYALYYKAKGKMPTMKEAIDGMRRCEKRQKEIVEYNRRADQAFQSAYNSVEALLKVVSDFPNANSADKVPVRIKQLEAQAKKDRAEKRWQSIRTYESIEIFEAFIREFPESDRVEDARYRIKELQRKEDDKKRDDEIRRQKIAEDERIRNCKKCGGTHYQTIHETCNRCKGKGSRVVSSQVCYNCNGNKGFSTPGGCYGCNGYGKVYCGTCRGTGGIKFETVYGTIGGCKTCKGTGVLLCGSCNGSGCKWSSCNTCEGAGKTQQTSDCETCYGSGKSTREVRCSH